MQLTKEGYSEGPTTTYFYKTSEDWGQTPILDLRTRPDFREGNEGSYSLISQNSSYQVRSSNQGMRVY